MQREHKDWQKRNFPQSMSSENSMLGMVEEMGELAHAMLKFKQGIRGMDDEQVVLEKIIDAHCDLIIFSFGLAEAMGYDLGHELEDTWNRVRTRDWVADPIQGGES